jgi:hypothetical protein
MPTPRQYPTAAERQAAYRERSLQATRALLASKGLPGPAAVPTMPSTRRWNAMACHALALIQQIREEMSAYQAQRSEAWQESESAEEFDERLGQVDDALAALEELIPAPPTTAPRKEVHTATTGP